MFMWSPLYAYYQIRSGVHYTQELAASRVTSVLLGTGCLMQNGPNAFSNVEAYPWIQLTLRDSANGNYSLSQEPLQNITLISITCSKAYTQEVYLKLLKEISTTLNGELILEEDENGNEDVVLQCRQ